MIVGATPALTNGTIRAAIACRPDSEVLGLLQLAGIDRTVAVVRRSRGISLTNSLTGSGS